MSLVKAKCPNCGIVHEVDSDKKAAVCPRCNEAYVVEDAITSYMTSKENDDSDGGFVRDDRSSGARIKAGEAFLKIKQWDKADEAFRDACDLTPQNYYGWWGRIRALTEEFTRFLDDTGARNIYIHARETKLKQLEDLYSSAATFAPEDIRESLSRTFTAYADSVRKTIISGKEFNARCNSILVREIAKTEAQISEADEGYMLHDTYKEPDRVRKLAAKGLGTFLGLLSIACAIWLVFAIIKKTSFIIPLLVLIVLIVVIFVAASIDKRNKETNRSNSEAREKYRRMKKELAMALDIKKTARIILNEETEDHSFHTSDDKSLRDAANRFLVDIINSEK